MDPPELTEVTLSPKPNVSPDLKEYPKSRENVLLVVIPLITPASVKSFPAGVLGDRFVFAPDPTK